MQKKIPCPCCTKDAFKTSYYINNSFNKKRYYYFCVFCDHKFLTEINKNDVLNYYKEIKSEVSKRYFKGFKKRKSLIKNKISKYIPKKPISILEIGPGSVGLLSIFNNQSQYIVVEPNQNNRKYLIKKNKELICYNKIDDIHETEIDIMISMSCFEHFVDPKDEFNKILRKLKIGSTVIIGVPDSYIELPKFLVLNEDEQQEDKEVFADKDHIHCFSQNSLKKLISKDCEIIDIVPIFPKKYAEYIGEFSSNLNRIINKHHYLSLRSYLQLMSLIIRGSLLKLFYFFYNIDFDFIIIAKKIK